MAVYALPISLPLELLIKRETTIVWERKTGKPIANAIVWQDTRVSDDVRRFSTTGGQDRFRPANWLATQHLLQRPKTTLAVAEHSRREGKNGFRRFTFRKCRYLPPLEP